MSLYLEFDKLVHAVTAAKVRFAVAGGLAVGLHGYLRATKDIDLLIEPAELAKVREVMRRLGYRENKILVRFRNSGLGLCRFYRRPPAEEELFVIDVLLAESASARSILKRARPQPYADLRVRVVAMPDLFHMKRQRGSKQDAADIEELKKRHATKRKEPDAL